MALYCNSLVSTIARSNVSVKLFLLAFSPVKFLPSVFLEALTYGVFEKEFWANRPVAKSFLAGALPAKELSIW